MSSFILLKTHWIAGGCGSDKLEGKPTGIFNIDLLVELAQEEWVSGAGLLLGRRQVGLGHHPASHLFALPACLAQNSLFPVPAPDSLPRAVFSIWRAMSCFLPCPGSAGFAPPSKSPSDPELS